MKKFLVILLVLMTCFVANVNAQEWTFLYKTNLGSSGELTLYKKNDEYAVQYKGASGSCKHGLVFEGINFINDEIHIVLGNKVNYCEKVKLIINKDGLGGRQELNINGQWVYDNVKDNLKFIRGSSLSELLLNLRENNKNLIAQVQNQELSNTKIIDGKTKPLIPTSFNVTQAEPEKAKTQETNDSADQDTSQLVPASSMAWALPIQNTVDQPLRITKYSGPNDSLSLEVKPFQKVLAPFDGVLIYSGGLGPAKTGFVILHKNNLVSVISSSYSWEETTYFMPGSLLQKGQQLALIRGGRPTALLGLRWHLYSVNKGLSNELSSYVLNVNEGQFKAENGINDK